MSNKPMVINEAQTVAKGEVCVPKDKVTSEIENMATEILNLTPFEMLAIVKVGK